MSNEHLKLLSKIAYMYYMDNLSQQQISDSLNFSRSKVSRLLLEAKEKGVVQINIMTPITRCVELEHQLKELYHLEEAVVVPVYSDKAESILESLGEAGADFLMKHIEDGTSIGFSMGETLKHVAYHLPIKKKFPNCNVVSIMGGIWLESSELDANTITQRVAEKIGGKFYPLYTPAIVSDQELKESILKESSIQNVLKKVMETDYTLISVGVQSSLFAHANLLSETEKEQTRQNKIVGEVACWLYDINGKIADLPFQNRIVGPSINQISDKSKIVLVSGTNEKKAAILAALKGKWVHTLITDEKVAAYLIQDKKK